MSPAILGNQNKFLLVQIVTAYTFYRVMLIKGLESNDSMNSF